MALIKLGGLAQDVRASLNGTTFSRNRGGAYVRTKVSPVQPRSEAQLRQRAIFSTNSKAWSGTLDDSQRAAWTAFAAANPLTNVFGDSITVSGLAAYQQLNAVLGTIGVAQENDPPVDKSVPVLAAPTGLNIESDSDLVDITTAAQATQAGAKYYIFATASLAPGKVPAESAFRFIAAKAAVAAAVIINVTTEYVDKFGSPIVGKKIWFLIASVNVETGAVTVGQKFSTIVTAGA